MMKSKFNVKLALLVVCMVLFNSITFAFADSTQNINENSNVSEYTNEVSVNGYGYLPNWDRDIERLNEFSTDIKYEFIEENLIGEIIVPFENNNILVEFNLIEDEVEQNYYGYSEISIDNKIINVDLAAEVIDSSIENFSLIIGDIIAYNIGNTISFEELNTTVKDIKKKEKVLNESSESNSYLSSNDGAIIGEDSNDNLYAHTTLPYLQVGGDYGWLGTRVFTNRTIELAKISSIDIRGTKSGPTYEILSVSPAGSGTSPRTLTTYIFYLFLANYIPVTFPVEGYNGAHTASSWEHRYIMWDDWNSHIYDGDSNNNGIISDVRVRKIEPAGRISGTVDVTVTRYVTATGYFTNTLTYDYIY